jgi:HAE1 family hydrophobic/amphiphilic exporter-1
VIENVQRHLEGQTVEGTDECVHDPHKATIIAMAEVTSAVIATSLVLISVFVPVSLFPGTTGILYKQFSLTIAFSIAISAFNALTLSPALASVFLRPETRPSGLMAVFLDPVEALIHKTIRVYAAAVTWVVKWRYAFLLLFIAGLSATVYEYNHVPTAFVPAEDQGYFLILVQTPPGASLSYTTDFADKGAALVQQDPDVYGTFSVMGFSLSGGSSPNQGIIFAPTKPEADRTKLGPGHTTHDAVVRLSQKLSAASSLCCRTAGATRSVTSIAWRIRWLRRRRIRPPGCLA